jgi:hypothetical protein
MMTKVGRSDGEATFAGRRGNDKVAPIPAVRDPKIERQGSTLNSHLGSAVVSRSPGSLWLV